MDNSIHPELLEALQGIHDELKRMNQTLATIAKKPAERSAEPGAASAGPSRPYGAAGRLAGKRPGTYSRPRRDGEFSGEGAEPAASRFPKKKGSARSSAGPARPKGKLPPKKGGGYPKNPK